MHRNLKIAAALAFAALAFSGSYADSSLPKVKILGKSFYYYETKKDESLYGIAKRFGFDPEILAATNREVPANPDKGTLIYYPVGKEVAGFDSEATNDDPATQAVSQSGQLYHTVAGDESLYGISKKYDISIDRLTELNPQIANGALREGMLLRLNDDQPVVLHEAVGTTQTPSATAPVASVQDSSKTTSTEPQIVKSEPVSYTIAGDSVSLVNDSIAPAIQYYPANIAIVLTDAGTTADEIRVKKNKEREFSRGALTAVDELKNGPAKINLTIISGKNAPEVIRTKLDNFAPRMIVTTSDKTVPDYLVNYADSAQVMLLNAFDTRDEKYLTNKNVIQYLAPTSYMNKEVADYFTDKFKDYKLYVAGPVEETDLMGQAVIQQFAQLGDDKVEEIEIDAIPTLTLPEGEGKYLIYSSKTVKADVKHLLDNITTLRNRYLMSDFRVLGRPNWIQYTTSLKEELGSNYSFIPTRFIFDPEDESTKEFINHYESLFSLRPMKSSPVYCATAYDIIKYFVPNISMNPTLEDNTFVYTPTIQSPINFERLETGGVVNKGIYIINMMPFGMKETIAVPEL